ncbi:HNH endonuclease signature motif containing protein [Pseudomonas sp.]|uniref:HNH endonuclease signature motif containing protein n=1 Tax=Pseudomonas sp. TaxID=306 RepID=UPI003FD87D31
MATQEIFKKRFFKKVMITPGCWIWKGGMKGGQYGAFHVENGKSVFAHRFSYEIHIGEIQPGNVICHRCDNPSCVNPDHLFSGTQAVNMKDRDRKGRQNKGVAQHSAKLTPEIVAQIRSLYVYRSKDFNTITLAKRFGVGGNQILKIVNNIDWKEK